MEVKIRLSKFLAHQGIGSRRGIEKLISKRQITVNGDVVIAQGTKIDPNEDMICVNGTKVKTQDRFHYVWLNKPPDVVSSRVSETGELTVMNFIDNPSLYPVGRLDKDSSGLILMTNDGELTHRLTHPKFHLEKTYHVQVKGLITHAKLKKLQQGINLSEGVTAPAIVTRLKANYEDLSLSGSAWLEFKLHEGKNRQIRRMCGAVQLEVISLIRIAIGPIQLGNLDSGQSRLATKREVDSLRSLTGLTSQSKDFALR